MHTLYNRSAKLEYLYRFAIFKQYRNAAIIPMGRRRFWREKRVEIRVERRRQHYWPA